MTTVIKDARATHSLGVRELARRCQVAASTVVDWERSEAAGTIQWGTLTRALEAMGERLTISRHGIEVQPIRLERREHRLGLELHRKIAVKLIEDPRRVLELAKGRIPRSRENVQGGAKAWVDEWEALIASGDLGKLIDVMTGTSQRDLDLRSVSPFVGLLAAAEREDVLERASR
jgi:transcriptional regulator with XRE-family HTH domain